MQLPEQLLADTSIPPGAKLVLAAFWSRAEGSPPWTCARNTEIAASAGVSMRTLKRARKLLVTRGAIRREARQLAGRHVDGWGLFGVIMPLQGPRMPPATAKGATQRVAKREDAHAVAVVQDDRLAVDRAQIAKHARPGDSHVQICERLRKAKAPCSDLAVAEVDGVVERISDGTVVVTPQGGGEPRVHVVPKGRRLRVAPGVAVRVGEQLVEGEWHKIKVFRRIERMAEELGLLGKRLRAGDIVARWRKTR